MRRADPRKLRAEVIRHLSADEIEDLGIMLSAGSDDYRAWVGPPFCYDVSGAMQFQFLFDLGLREYHRVLEIGCGSLRTGRLLIPWLLKRRYYGVEPNGKMLRQGLYEHFGWPARVWANPTLRRKCPRFRISGEFDYRFVGRAVDYIIAQSILSHTGPAETEALIAAVSHVSHESTTTLVTYIRCDDPASMCRQDGWHYPACVLYTDDFMGDVAAKHGFRAWSTNWPLGNRQPDGLITTQCPLVLRKSDWMPSAAQEAAGDIRQLA